jgi:hypothetical protein
MSAYVYSWFSKIEYYAKGEKEENLCASFLLLQEYFGVLIEDIGSSGMRLRG